MERVSILVLVLVLCGLVALAGYNATANPLKGRKAALETSLAGIQPVEVAFEGPGWDFDKWQNSLAAKPALWMELVPPPPPPPPPPEKPPDTKAMIKDLSAGRQQVGGKVKIMSKGNPRGTFMSVGETLNGMTIKEINKTEVVLSLMWKDKELLEVLPRQ